MASTLSQAALTGRRALVTGGSRGIGRSTALAFARAGAMVAFNYARGEDEVEADETLAALRTAGAMAYAARADVADAAAVRRLVREAHDALGGPFDILVNNAAVSHDAPLMMLSESAWDRVVDVNLKGPYLCCREVLPGMVERRWGRIVNVVSPAAFLGKEGASSYAAAKGALVALTKSVAREVAAHGITANAVSPGYVDTQLVAHLRDEARRDLERDIPLGRFGRPEEIGAVILFLASPAASYLTGTCVHADGGLVML